MSQTSNLGTQLGFPLGFNSVSDGSLTKSVSDTLSLSDSIFLSSLNVELISDTIFLSDASSVLNLLEISSSDFLSLSDAINSLNAYSNQSSDTLSQLLTYATAFSGVIALSDSTIVRTTVPSHIPIWHLQQSMSGVLSG